MICSSDNRCSTREQWMVTSRQCHVQLRSSGRIKACMRVGQHSMMRRWCLNQAEARVATQEGMSYGCEGKNRRWRQCGYKSGSKRAKATDVKQHLMVVGVGHRHGCKGKKSR